MLQADVSVSRSALDRANAELTSLGSDKARLTVELMSAQRGQEARCVQGVCVWGGHKDCPTIVLPHNSDPSNPSNLSLTLNLPYASPSPLLPLRSLTLRLPRSQRRRPPSGP